MKKFSLWAPVCAWCLLIFAFSSIPHLSSGLEWDYILRKAAHIGEYGVLFILLRRALQGTFAAQPRWTWAAALLSVLYAMTDEVHQGFVPGRDASWGDVAIDAGGVVLGALGLAAAKAWKPRWNKIKAPIV